MKREEKNELSKAKILSAALQEFAALGYARSSINTICSEGDISKGIIYHYFKDKDEMYLVCVKECFDALTVYMRDHIAETEPHGVQAYFDARLSFFKENPLYQSLFCDAVLSPPSHLKEAIADSKANLDALNIEVLTGLLRGRRLRNNISSKQAIDVVLLFQDFVNARYQMLSGSDFDMAAHEALCRRSLDILLYGIIEQEAK